MNALSRCKPAPRLRERIGAQTVGPERTVHRRARRGFGTGTAAAIEALRPNDLENRLRCVADRSQFGGGQLLRVLAFGRAVGMTDNERACRRSVS